MAAGSRVVHTRLPQGIGLTSRLVALSSLAEGAAAEVSGGGASAAAGLSKLLGKCSRVIQVVGPATLAFDPMG